MFIAGVSLFDLPRNKRAQYLNEKYVGKRVMMIWRRGRPTPTRQRGTLASHPTRGQCGLFKADMDEFGQGSEEEVGRLISNMK